VRGRLLIPRQIFRGQATVLGFLQQTRLALNLVNELLAGDSIHGTQIDASAAHRFDDEFKWVAARPSR
jgi:hypothetical protein